MSIRKAAVEERKRLDETASAIGVRRETVRLWRDRFNEHGADGLEKLHSTPVGGTLAAPRAELVSVRKDNAAEIPHGLFLGDARAEEKPASTRGTRSPVA
jgi:transposase-like protein